MIIYDKEISIRVWENKGGLINDTSLRVGHAAASLRALQGNDIKSNYISWWPAADDLNDHKNIGFDKAQTRSASPKANYLADKNAETSDSARERYKRSNAYNLAKEKGDYVYSLVTKMQSSEAQLNYIAEMRTDATEELDYEHREAQKQEYQIRNKYLIQYLDGLERAVGQGLSIEDMPSFPEASSQDIFEDRANVGYRAGEINTKADIKESIPGMYSRLCFQKSRDGVKIAVVALTDKDREKIKDCKKEINEYIQDNQIAYWGLNLNAIAFAWRNFLDSQTHGYKFASKSRNCAGVIWEMLQAGGFQCYLNSRTQLMWRTPNDIRNDVKALAEHLLILNHMTLRFKKEMVDSGLYQSSDGNLVKSIKERNPELWDLNDFKRFSKSPNTLAFRRDQVSKIDEALRKYHSMRWSPESYNKKLSYILEMFGNIIDHRERKPESDRRRGVDLLGVQILKLIESGIPERAYNSLHVVIADANTAFERRRQNNPAGRRVVK
jgi:hypothetical protein